MPELSILSLIQRGLGWEHRKQRSQAAEWYSMHSVSVNPAILIDEGKTHGLVGDVYGTHGALLDGGGGYKCRLGQACQIRHFDLDIQTPLPGAYQNGLQAGRGLIDVYAEVTPR